MHQSTPEVILELSDNEIFVFGSNLAGRHGRGAAGTAYQRFGAIWGAGYGMMGKSFAIPTKNYDLDPMLLTDISFYVRNFLKEAADRCDLTFLVTPIGCGLAGYAPSQIAPMFRDHTKNVVLPLSFQPYL